MDVPARTRKFILVAFAAATIWGSVLVLIGRSPGYHSTPGIWCALAGLPGVVVSTWLSNWSDSENSVLTTAYWIAAVCVNWIFYFGLLFVVSAVARKITARHGAAVQGRRS
jgi:membrane protein DedA with SNARE-associated domain